MRVSELRARDVVDVADGRRLGTVEDVEIDLERGSVTALVVPTGGKLFGLWGGEGDAVIPWNAVVTIGADVILVRRPRPSSAEPAARTSG